MDGVKAIADALHKNTKEKLISWGEHEFRYMEVQPSSPLRKHGFVESMGGGAVRLTDLGKIARDHLKNG